MSALGEKKESAREVGEYSLAAIKEALRALQLPPQSTQALQKALELQWQTFAKVTPVSRSDFFGTPGPQGLAGSEQFKRQH